MARRSDHSREELYELAMQAARRIVEVDGFRGLTARNVADAIGYSPGTLYNVFENLDDMIVHLNGRTLDELHAALAFASLKGDPTSDIRLLLDVYLGYLEKHPHLWKMLFEFSLPDGRELPDWYELKVSKVLGLVEKALAPLFTADEVQEKRNAASVLWAGLHGICSLSDTGKLQVVTTQSVPDMAESLTTNFIAGLSAIRKEH